MNAARADSALPSPRADGNRVLWLYAISITIWALDFRALRGQSALAYQAPILMVYLSCFVLIVLAASKRGIGIGPLWVFMAVIGLFMIDSSIAGLINGQPAYAIIANLIPLSLYLTAAISTYIVLSLGSGEAHPILQALRVSCLVSSVGHLAVIIVSRGGINLATSRYEVLSGAVIPSLGIIAVGLTQRVSALDLAVVVFNLVVSLLSVTRTLIGVLAGQVMLVILARPGVLFSPTTRRSGLAFGLILLSLIGADFVAGTGLAGRWTERLAVHSKFLADPSALIRLAETHFMWDRFKSTPDRLLFGNGLASVTSAIGREDVQAESLVGREAAHIHTTGIGHENYVGILYVAGLVGGGGVIVLQFVNALQSFALIRTLQLRRLQYRHYDAHVGIWGGVIVLGILAAGFGAGIFGDRPTMTWLGVGTGILYWARQLMLASETPPVEQPAGRFARSPRTINSYPRP